VPDCDYCEEVFEDEGAYLGHLEDEHYDELSRIDRRRVDERDTGSDVSTGQLVIGAVLVSGVLLLAAFYLFNGGLGLGGGDDRPATRGDEVIPEGIESEPLSDRGNETLLQGTQTFEPASRDHVAPGTNVDYETFPPVGGPHYDRPVPVGFYEQELQLPRLVHNLEHGHIVVYYDPSALTPAARDSLDRFVDRHDSTWSAVVVAPYPGDDPSADYVLTAWGAKLEMDGYDARVVRAFLSEYIGRGPETPVRRVGAAGSGPVPTA